MVSRTLQRILMIEDESDIRTVAKLALEAIGGFQVQTCGSGAEALSLAPTLEADLILLDVMMPGMDGLTVFNELRGIARTEHTPIIFMTAKAQVQEIAQYQASGALDVIAKPFDPMTLAHTVSSIWQRHHSA
jgi:two-component system OmpR family response regulator